MVHARDIYTYDYDYSISRSPFRAGMYRVHADSGEGYHTLPPTGVLQSVLAFHELLWEDPCQHRAAKRATR